MEEIVKKFDDKTSQKRSIKVNRPKGALISGIVIIFIALITTGIFILGFIGLSLEGEKIAGDEVEGIIYLCLAIIMILSGGIAILARKYKTGGMLCLVFGILLAFGFWYFGIPVAVCGLISLRSSDKLEDALLAKLQETNSIALSELALTLKKTEADVEFAAMKLNRAGKNIAFDPETRIVSCK